MSFDRDVLLNECRDLTRNRLHEAMNEAFAKVEGDLVRKIEGAATPAEVDAVFRTISHIKQGRAQLVQYFSQRFDDIFRRNVERSETSEALRGEVSSEELRLVEPHELEMELETERMAKTAMQDINEGEVRALRIRMAHVFGVEALEDKDNPLYAGNVLEALRAACAQLQCDATVQTVMLQAFRPYLSAGLDKAYSEVNRALIRRNVMPKIKLSVSNSGGSDGTADDGDTVLGGSMGDALPEADSAEAALAKHVGRSPEGLERLMQAVEEIARGASVGDALAKAIPLSGAMPGVIFNSSADVPMEIRRVAARALCDPGSLGMIQTQVAAPALVEHLSGMQGSMEESYANAGLDGRPIDLRRIDVLSQLGNRAGHASVIDQVTIDLVGEMFETIIADKAINELAKAQLLRLQIVTVKAALLDRTFFANDEHPVRRLIELVSKAGAEPDIDFSPQAPFMVVLRSIIAEIVESFHDDFDLFIEAHERLTSLIEEARVARISSLDDTKKSLEAQEALDIAQRRAMVEIGIRCEESTPKFVQEFLRSVWAKAMVEAEINGRLEGEEGWTSRAQLIDRLVWSLKPKSHNEIKELARTVSEILRGLISGMLEAKMPRDERTIFFDELMSAHTQIVQAAKARSLQQGAADEGRPHLTSVQGGASVEAPLFPRESGRPQAVPAAEAAGASTAVATAAAAAARRSIAGESVIDNEEVAQIEARGLHNGSLVEFRDTSMRARLMWVSPQRTTYLFVSTGMSRSLMHKDVVAMLRDGVMRVVTHDEGSLVNKLFRRLEQSEELAAAA